MQSTNWTPEHSSALREYLAKGMSYSEIAQAINAKFSTAYTRHRRDRPRQAIGASRRRPPPGLRQAGAESLPIKHPQDAGTLRFPVRMDRAGFRTRRDRQASLRRNQSAPSVIAGARGPAIAATLMAATRRVKPSLSAASRAARVPAIARRIFI